MAETGEIAIRGLWKKLTGQAAREERARLARALELQKAQEAEGRRDAHAESRMKAFQVVTRVTRTPLPDLGIDEVRKAVKEIEGQVTGRSIYGKFPPKVRMKDHVFHPEQRVEFMEYGDKSAFMQNFRWGGSLLGDFGQVLHERSSRSIPVFEELAKKHFLMVVNVPNTEDAVLSCQFLQNWRDSFGRAASAVTMNFRLKRESAYKLLDLVRIEPEAAEMFLQTAAEGFEADSPSSPAVGIPRVRSDGVVIVNLDRFNPHCFSNMDSLSNLTHKIVQEMVQNKDGQIEVYKYSAPHGVANPNTIPT